MRSLVVTLLCCAALVCGSNAVAGAQATGNIQTPGAIQTPGEIQKPGEIQAPTGPWQKPGEIQKPGDIRKVVAPGGCQTTLVAPADALFAFDRRDLGPGAQATLKQIAAGVAERAPRSVIVRGYTDGKGSDEYNRKLSAARAAAVGNWLKPKLSVAISTEAHGKNDPVAPNTNADGSDNPDGRTRNRRVEIVLEYCHA